MSAIEKVNNSGLSADEKKALKALMGHKPAIRDQIAEDSAVDDSLLRAYLNGPGTIGPAGDGTLYYCEGNTIYDFWCALVKTNSVAYDETNKKLKFTDGVTRWGWERDVEELYVRECYISAVNTLRDVDMAMVEGTPGIGKSLFIFYLIYVIVSEAFERGEKVPTFVIADRDDEDYFLRVDSNGNGVVHKPTTELTPDYLITDTRGRSSCLFTRQYIHVSGINNTNVKDVRKMMKQRPPKNKKPRRFISFPGFSWQEYFEADSNGQTNPTAIRFYYDVFGGSLRNLRFPEQMDEDDACPKDIYEVVQAEMESFFGGFELAGIPEATWNRTARALAKELVTPREGLTDSHQIDPYAISRSVLIHWTLTAENPPTWDDVPATRFMRHLAGYISDSSEKDALHRLKEAIGPSGMGYVHEHDAHQFRLANLGKAPGITLWSLEGEPARTLCLPIRRVVRIRTVDDIERLEEGDYGLPTVSNFPFLDAVMKPNYIFQDTVAQGRHPSEAKIPEILRALKTTADVGPVVLVNTLAVDNFDKFKMNSSDVMKSFSQWKTRMEVHADDVAVVKNLTRKVSEVSKRGKRTLTDTTAESMPKGKKSKK